MPDRILISACLAGIRSRYDGTSRDHPCLADLATRAVLIPVCPEILGGLGIPRPRCHFLNGDGRDVFAGRARVIDANGIDRTALFVRGAEETLRIVELTCPDLILFKEGSPSCGLRRADIEGRRQPGCGVTTALLQDQGIRIISEDDPLP